MHIEEIFRTHKDNGDIACMFQKEWDLKGIPHIINLTFDCKQIRIKMEQILEVPGGPGMIEQNEFEVDDEVEGGEGETGMQSNPSNENSLMVHHKVHSFESDVTIPEGNSPGDV